MHRFFRTISGLSIGYAISVLVYPHGMVGPSGSELLSGQWVQIILPVITALITTFWPQALEFWNWILSLVQGKSTTQAETPAEALSHVQAVELYLAKVKCDRGVETCMTLRLAIHGLEKECRHNDPLAA